MSYEPTIIIKKKDLEKNRNKIEEVLNSIRYSTPKIQHKYNQDVYEELEKALNMKVVKFTELEIVIIYPELTEHNRRVRELLDVYEIEYQIDN